jgi:hypothetical protein
VEARAFLIKFVMTAASTFVNHAKWQSVVQLISAFALVHLYLRWQPHMNRQG